MIRPIQMTNEIISDTKVIFARGNAVIQFARCGCPALPVELAALEGVACALATVGEHVRGPRARHRLLRRSRHWKVTSGRDRLCRPDHASNHHGLYIIEIVL